MEKFLYFIHEKPIFGDKKKAERLPQIVKFLESKCPRNLRLTDKNQAEGPFDSLYELKRNSLILAGYKKQNDRQKILKSSNIIEGKEFIFTKPGESFGIDFINAFTHVTLGKISKRQVKGLHFYNPKTTRIIEVLYIDSKTKCYVARIEKFNKNTGEWIEKEFDSSFFPDDWSMHKLFHEFKYSYQKRKHIEGKKYHSETSEGISVEFIINEEDKIITCYPLVNKIE